MLITISLIIAFIALAIGSYTDIKTREVPDWVSYATIFLGVGIAVLASIIYWTYTYILNSVIGLATGLALGYLMFYTGQWGGGDSKMLFGLGALIGLDIFSFPGIPLLLLFLITTLFVGAAYGLVWSGMLALKNRRRCLHRIRSTLSHSKVIFYRKLLLVFCFAGLAAMIAIPYPMKISVFLIILLTFITFYLWIFIKAVEEICMIKQVDPKVLTEGDWIAKPVTVKGKLIAGPKDLGVSKEQIKQLIAFKKQRKLDKITIKEGIPFVPSFMIAYLVALLIHFSGVGVFGWFV